MKKFIKNNLLGFLLGIILTIGTCVYATTQILASNVTYKNKTLEQTLNELYLNQAVKKVCKLESGTINKVGSKYKCKVGNFR